MQMVRWSLMLVLVVGACSDDGAAGATATGPTTGAESGSAQSTSSDGTDTDVSGLGEPLRLHHIQALGTHNSYHLDPGVAILPWQYSHRPLDEQLAIGVRQFELDVYRDSEGAFEVYHVAQLDAESNCPRLADCLGALSSWSAANPHHHPFVVMIEPKDGVDAAGADAFLDALEAEVSAIWPDERILRPELVARDHGSLRAGLQAEGWPEIDDVRGTALFVLHTGGPLRDALVARGPSGSVLFPDAMGDLEADHAAFHSMNDPIDGGEAIRAAVGAGHLVRTRADADNVEPSAGDGTRRDAALASGAHFVSTDWPEPADSGYVVEIPGGTPSRCNPLSAPEGCTSPAIEDPTSVGG
jgi:hypothetical protein